MRWLLAMLILAAGCSFGATADVVQVEIKTRAQLSPRVTLGNADNQFVGRFTVGNSNAFEDLRFPATILKVTTTKPPDFVAFTNGVYGYSFAGNANAEIYGWAQMPHSRKADSAIYPHIHLVQKGASSNLTVWALEYTWAAIGSTFGATSTITITNAPSYWPTHYMPKFGSIDGTGKNGSSMLGFRLERMTDDAADTNASAIFLLEFDLHYQVGQLGAEGVEP